MLESSATGGNLEGTSDDMPVELGGITTFEMDSLLALLDAR